MNLRTYRLPDVSSTWVNLEAKGSNNQIDYKKFFSLQRETNKAALLYPDLVLRGGREYNTNHTKDVRNVHEST